MRTPQNFRVMATSMCAGLRWKGGKGLRAFKHVQFAHSLHKSLVEHCSLLLWVHRNRTCARGSQLGCVNAYLHACIPNIASFHFILFILALFPPSSSLLTPMRATSGASTPATTTRTALWTPSRTSHTQ